MADRYFPTFEEYVASLKSWSMPVEGYAEYVAYLDDMGHTRRLLAAIDDGLEMSPLAVAEVPKRGLMATLGATYFREQPGFDDDGRFTPTRFAFVFEFHRAAFPEHEAFMRAAAAQLDRMFAAGRVSTDLDYLANYVNQVSARVNAGGDSGALVPLAAHFVDRVRAVFALQVRQAEQLGGVHAAAARGTVGRIGYEAQRVLVEVDALRDELFRERWLRAAIGEAEWLEARQLAAPVLKELYAGVWAGGYSGYHERMVAGSLV